MCVQRNFLVAALLKNPLTLPLNLNPMKSSLRIAASHFSVSGSITRNARYIESQMKEAAENGVQLIHFPETSLTGWGPSHFKSFQNYNWANLDHQVQRICELSLSLNLWVVLGLMRRMENGLPRNCLQVISNEGLVAGIYDKQRLYKAEEGYYSAGNKPLVIEINGFKCGFLICYDDCFPELYEVYRDMGVGLLFHSIYNAGTRKAKATRFKEIIKANLIVRAMDHQMWISASNSSKRYSPLSACVVRPDGTMIRSGRNHVVGMVIEDYPIADLGWTYNNREI